MSSQWENVVSKCLYVGSTILQLKTWLLTGSHFAWWKPEIFLCYIINLFPVKVEGRVLGDMSRKRQGRNAHPYHTQMHSVAHIKGMVVLWTLGPADNYIQAEGRILAHNRENRNIISYTDRIKLSTFSVPCANLSSDKVKNFGRKPKSFRSSSASHLDWSNSQEN